MARRRESPFGDGSGRFCLPGGSVTSHRDESVTRAGPARARADGMPRRCTGKASARRDIPGHEHMPSRLSLEAAGRQKSSMIPHNEDARTQNFA